MGDLPNTETLRSRGMGPASGRPFSPISVALGKDVMLVARKEDLLDAIDFTFFSSLSPVQVHQVFIYEVVYLWSHLLSHVVTVLEKNQASNRPT